MDATLEALRSGAEDVLIQIDDLEEAATISNVLRTNNNVTRISLGPRTVPRLNANSVNLILRSLTPKHYKWIKMLTLTNCELEDSVCDPTTGSLAFVLNEAKGFSYSDDSDEAVADSYIRRLVGVLNNIRSLETVNLQTRASSQAVRLFLSYVGEAIEYLTLTGMTFDGAILDSFGDFFIRTRRRLVSLDIQSCSFVNNKSIISKILGFLRSIQKSNLMRLLIKFPAFAVESDAEDVIGQLGLCKSLRVLDVDCPDKYKSIVEYYLGVGLPRLIYLNRKFKQNGVRLARTFAVNGSIPFNLDAKPAISQSGMNAPDVPNHTSVYLNNMRSDELKSMLTKRNVISESVGSLVITDSEISPSLFMNINTIFPKITHISLKTCGVRIEHINNHSFVTMFPSLTNLQVPDNDTITSLSNLGVGLNVTYLSFAWCALTSIDLPDRVAKQLTTLDLHGNLGITEPPFDFVMRYPNIDVQLARCGFTLNPPYNKRVRNVCETVRLVYKAKLLCAISRELGLILDDEKIMKMFIK